ncbi:MAG: type II secretion system protein M [Acidobacteria bacterium]|nr:type II secretion system protein M [Acidobacteriota bacterium]
MRDEPAHTSEHGIPTPPKGARGQFHKLRDSRRRSSIIGLPEVAALAASALLLLTAVGAYVFMLRPQTARAQSLKDELASLERQLPSLRSNISQDKDTQTSVREILDSLQGFETEHLGQSSSGGGSTNVIEELNALIRRNKLRISGGLAFTQLEETVPGTEKKRQQQQREGGGATTSATRTVQSVFPGIGITLTVEGSYPNLRHFIRDVEASRQFIAIDSVELEGITDNGSSAGTSIESVAVAPGINPTGVSPTVARPSGARGTLVSLRLDMAAYFRRTNAQGEMTSPAAGTTAR